VWCCDGEAMSKRIAHPYLQPLQQSLQERFHETNAKAMSQYMRNLFPFFGVATPIRTLLFKEHIKQFGLPTFKEQTKVLKSCMAQSERDFHYFAIHLLGKYVKEDAVKFSELMMYLITTNSWWDSVDGTSSSSVRPFFKLHPELAPKITRTWMDSGNFWLQRSAIIFQMGYREKTNEKLLFDYCLELKDEKEFFIQKAIGWALREYSKTNPKKVSAFLKANKLAPLSVREASKYL
jgi:3-methyladenine DNA glycosylase AlkD